MSKDKVSNDMPQELIIIGAGGFSREVAWLVERINAVQPTWNILGFLDDNPSIKGTLIGGYKVLGVCEDAVRYPNAVFVCAIGGTRTRKHIIDKITGILGNARFATLIDPSVEMSERIAVGEGSIICAHTVLTVDIVIGKHVIINLDCTVGHDVRIEDYVTLYPSANISGNAEIGALAELGTGMQIIQGKKVGAGSIIGAGAIVVKDIPANCTAVGNPAKPIKFFEVVPENT